MVAIFEITLLIVGAVLGTLWFRRTKLYRARKGYPNFNPNGGDPKGPFTDPPMSGRGGTT